jgi:hypothetical protein
MEPHGQAPFPAEYDRGNAADLPMIVIRWLIFWLTELVG